MEMAGRLVRGELRRLANYGAVVLDEHDCVARVRLSVADRVSNGRTSSRIRVIFPIRDRKRVTPMV